MRLSPFYIVNGNKKFSFYNGFNETKNSFTMSYFAISLSPNKVIVLIAGTEIYFMKAFLLAIVHKTMLKSSMEQYHIVIFVASNNSKFQILTNLNASVPCSISLSPSKIPRNWPAHLAITNFSLVNQRTSLLIATACIWIHPESFKLTNPSAFVLQDITMRNKIT